MKKPIKLQETVTGLPIHSVHEAKEEPNPFTAADWRMFFYAWTGFALRVLLCVGAVFSALQYLQARQEKRVERTLSLVELWERPEYQEAQSAVKRRLADLNRQSAGLVTSETTAEQMDIIMSSIGSKAMTEDGGAMPLVEFQDRFDRVLYFLSRLSSCVETNLCDRAVADEFFLDYARSFWRFFSTWIERERKRGTPTLGIGVENYIKAQR